MLKLKLFEFLSQQQGVIQKIVPSYEVFEVYR